MLLPPWDLGLPHRLRLFGETAILAPLDLSARDYSTARFLTHAPTNKKAPVGFVTLGDSAEPVVVEAFDNALLKYCDERGLRPNDTAEADLACQCISDAAHEVVGLAPCLKASVTELIRAIHLIHSAGEDYDSSHSDPLIPFSIFLSVPTLMGRRSILRVAEGIVHEAMHLQLSLFEATCPLVDETVRWELYSPWKQTKRQTQGIMHGLYVFSVLKWMWGHVRASSGSHEDRTFAARRTKDINDDINAVRDIIHSPALTPQGRDFVHAMLRA
jgi:HEXXH motif-containing protein